MPKMPPIKRKSTEVTMAKKLSLRRDTTVTLASSDESSSPASLRSSASIRRTTSKLSVKSSSSITSLKRKATLVSEGPGIYSSVIALDSGSCVGKTGSLKAASIGKDCDVIPVPPPVSKRRSGSRTSAAVNTLRKSVSELKDLMETTSAMKSSLSKRKSSLVKEPSLTKASLSKRKSSVPGLNPGTDSTTSPPLPPGGLLEIAISFDTTGSMYGSLEEIRGRIKDMVQRLQADIPGIRIAIIAHGDYCDAKNYIVKWIDFGATVPELCDFVETVKRTGGGDADECYELVLRRAREVLSWTPGSQRSLVVIGDSPPHEPGYTYDGFVNDIDWRVEARELKKMGVKIYSVYVTQTTVFRINRNWGTSFYEEIATVTGGRVIPLDKFGVLFDMLMSICYKESGSDLFDAYEAEVMERDKGKTMDTTLAGIFTTLGGKRSSVKFAPTLPGMLPMPGTGMRPGGPAIPLPWSGKFPVGPAPPLLGPGKFPVGPAPPLLGPGMFPGGHAPLGPGLLKLGPTGLFGTTTTPTSKSARKRNKTTKKSKKSKSRAESGGRLNRESLTDTKFIKGPLKQLVWSKWMVGISKTQSVIGPDIAFTRRDWCDAFCNGGVLKGKDVCDVPAVYEFAVSLNGKKKSYPVYYRVTTGVPHGSTWFNYLFAQKKVRRVIKDVVNTHTQILVRRGLFKRKRSSFIQKVSQMMFKKYDYAWTGRKERKMKFRSLKRCGVPISSNSY
ncbi:uncharacterized protein LOC110457297 [Mizuhopecten yessoensis]|uniref:Ariadne-like RING finger protein R811 n=1 Tax=Mizuhopecten yessoensis TaxID=6573 RepID=A0A210Q946_MIZYE|nr:uncharacterized protein LOC110457297 [Mizuhopecten yessoensis]OWF45263.1 Ariadne-like RING finger protein R811 [Mizuhopecten yessoensis]